MNQPTNDCNEGKHFFVNSDFCDKCDMDFDEWYTKTIEHIHKQTSIFLLGVLQSIMNEQVKARLLSHDTAKYILDAVRDQAVRQRWLE